MDKRATEIVRQLNRFDNKKGDVWKDVILRLPDYDREGSENFGNGSDAFVAGGMRFVYDYARARWTGGERHVPMAL